MTFLTPSRVQATADGSLCDVLVHWIAEQFQHDVPARRERPSIGIIAASGTLRDGRWPVYGGDAPIAHAILEAGGFPCLIPPLPLLEGYDLAHLLRDDHTHAGQCDLEHPVPETQAWSGDDAPGAKPPPAQSKDRMTGHKPARVWASMRGPDQSPARDYQGRAHRGHSSGHGVGD